MARWILVMAVVSLAGCSGTQVIPTDVAAAPTQAAGEPVATIHMDITGCLSCEMCRATMRRMAQEQGGDIRFEGDAVEIDFRGGEPLSFTELVRRMENSGIRNLRVLGVTFTAVGILRQEEGGPVFVLEGNGQALRVAEGADRLSGERQRVKLKVKGWRRGQDPSVEVMGTDPN